MREIEMAAKTTTRKTTVTHPDGTVSTRGSKTMTYTHAIEISPAPAESYAAYLDTLAADYDVKALQYTRAADAAKVVIKDRGFGPSATRNPLITHQATLVGSERGVYTWCSADGRTENITRDAKLADGTYPIVSVRDYLVDSARRSAEGYTENAAKYRAQAAKVRAEGTPVGSYGIVRWSTREDLARKALSEFSYATERGHTVKVVKVDA